jgi:CubicO group peptidase (beta-lactamase class C family)
MAGKIIAEITTSEVTKEMGIRKHIATGLRCWFAVTLLCVSVQAQTTSDRLDAFLGKWNQKNSPGMAALLIRNGRIEYRKGLGLADVEARTPITPNSQFLLGSISKQFIGDGDYDPRRPRESAVRRHTLQVLP